ncbi:PstA family ABC transporter permease [Roseimaritima sediminicola]|uniref:PstA family ABC transporter permease n=1 Tax=Roseimaritima sediminicola TaxID=2662066 RepID=UPI00129852CD|nr:ABC transporter permease subunit [Roseimaritima sediminicola]
MTMPAALQRDDANDQAAKAGRRKLISRWFYLLCIAIAMLSVLVLAVLLISISVQGGSRLSVDLLTNAHSELHPEQAGMWPAIVGTLFVCGVCALVALPLGVGTAVFLEEFKPRRPELRVLRRWIPLGQRRWDGVCTGLYKAMRGLHGFVQLNISNLAGVPSIVYGLLGLSVFVYMFNVFGQITVNESAGLELAGVRHYYQVLTLQRGEVVLIPQQDLQQATITVTEPVEAMLPSGERVTLSLWKPGTEKPTEPELRRRTVREGATGGRYSQKDWYYFRLPLGRSFLAAGLTLALVILPVVIIASQEALRGVPPSMREASLGLGATTWQTTRNVCLPAALPGILTGSILSMGRAIGEAAPILVVLGAAIAKNSGPQHLMDDAVTMPVLIYNWAGRQQQVYQELAAAAIIVLLVILLLVNSLAIYLRQRLRQT